MNPQKARSDGFLLLCLGALVFVAIGILMLVAQGGPGLDSKIAYNGARAFFEHRDPYQLADLLLVYQENGGRIPPACCGDTETLIAEAHYVYLPTIFAVTMPLASLPFPVFFVIWTGLAAAAFLVAAVMMWDVGSEHAPLLTGVLLCLFLINSGSLICTGNAASLALSLGIIGAWSFFRERAVPFGMACMAASLALKPHDSALIWLALFMFGGLVRKRAIQSLLVMGVAVSPAIFWVWHVAPNWFRELGSNVAWDLAKGAVDDPGPAAVLKRGALTFTNLQSALSLIRDEPRFYNSVSYAFGFLLIGIFIFMTIRFRRSSGGRWLGLAFVSAMTLLPFYHRQYDSKLLILTIPACAILWARGGKLGKVALIVTSLGLLMASDLPWAFYVAFTTNLKFTGIWFQLYFLSRALPVPCTFALVAVFFLVVYGRWLRAENHEQTSMGVRSDIVSQV